MSARMQVLELEEVKAATDSTVTSPLATFVAAAAFVAALLVGSGMIELLKSI